jgi:hypothetical protein
MGSSSPIVLNFSRFLAGIHGPNFDDNVIPAEKPAAPDEAG